jgi:hypothetical protein
MDYTDQPRVLNQTVEKECTKSHNMIITVQTHFNSRTNLEKHHRVNKLELAGISRARPLILAQSNILARVTRVLGLKLKLVCRSPARLRLLPSGSFIQDGRLGVNTGGTKPASADLPVLQTLAISPPPRRTRASRPAGTQ